MLEKKIKIIVEEPYEILMIGGTALCRIYNYNNDKQYGQYISTFSMIKDNLEIKNKVEIYIDKEYWECFLDDYGKVRARNIKDNNITPLIIDLPYNSVIFRKYNHKIIDVSDE